MNHQQSRIRDHLEGLAIEGARSSNDVDLFDQVALEADGYDLTALDDDLPAIAEELGL